MTNNFENENQEDFIEPENGLSEEAARPGVGGNLAEAWRTKPMFKFMVLVAAVFVVGVAAMNFLGGGNTSSSESAMHLAKPPNLKEAPGGADSPYMRQQTEMANKQRTDQALAEGGSVMPTPVGRLADSADFADKKEDPLKEYRAEVEKLQKQVQQQQVQQQQIQQAPRQPEQFDSSMAEAMQRQMQQLLDGWSPKGIKSVSVTKADAVAVANTGLSATQAVSANQHVTEQASSSTRKIIVNAGTVSYAQLLTEANSDVPGPILAQIVSGPLAGARAVGSFQVSDGYEKYLVLKFTLADKKGTNYQVNAIALDPDTTLGGMATEVDERYFSRVILPAAAGFLQGMGQALGQGNNSITSDGTTTITTQASNGYKQGIYNGLSQGAQTMGQFFQNQANLTKPLVRVAAGTPVGIFFVAPVLEPTAAAGYAEQPTNKNGSNSEGYGNNGYPGSTVNGYGNSNNSQSSSQQVPYPNYATSGSSSQMYGASGMGQYSPYSQGYPSYGR